MINNYVYKITLQNPETKDIITHNINLDCKVPLISIPMIAVENDIITKEDCSNLISVELVSDTEGLHECAQIIIQPKKELSTGKQFANLVANLYINDDKYYVMIDINNIREDEITILISPKIIPQIPDMKVCDINSAIRILNLNSKKTVSVNYMLLDELTNQSDTCNCHCTDCETENDECECDQDCKCKDNPEEDCCKSCDISDDCGCYQSKINRHHFSYNGNNNSNEEPEKYLKIPINPQFPKEEIISLSNAIIKRAKLIMGDNTSCDININIIKDDDSYESTLNISMEDEYIM